MRNIFLKLMWLFYLDGIGRLPEADVLFVCHDADRGFEFNRKQYSQILDSLNEMVASERMSTITIVSPFSKIHGDAAFGNVWLVNGTIARAYLVRVISSLFRWRSDGDNDSVVAAWSRILRKIKPGVILGIQPPRELCIAAKGLGIWVADVQHGILADHGYYGLKNRKKYDDYGWPDALLAWDEESANWINAESDGVVEGIAIGNPWHLRFIYPRDEDLIVNQFKSPPLIDDVGRPILVTLTWGVDYYGNYPEIGIPRALIDLMRSNQPQYNWWIRIHPVQLSSPNCEKTLNTLQDLFGRCSNVSWGECSKQPLPFILNCVALHITMMSSVTIEAEWYGVKTALLYDDTIFLQTHLGAQIQRGAAEIVPPEREAIIDWIENNLRSSEVYQSAVASISSGPCNHFILDIKRRVEDAKMYNGGNNEF